MLSSQSIHQILFIILWKLTKYIPYLIASNNPPHVLFFVVYSIEKQYITSYM